MLRKIVREINKISGVSRIIFFAGAGTALVLLGLSFLMSLSPETELSVKYLYEQMAKTSVTLFSQGVVFGLGCDFLLSALDRKSK